jgi:hypothetical protein
MAAPALTLRSLCQTLKLPTVARAAERLADVAHRQGQGLLAYLQQVLELEVVDRGRPPRRPPAQGSRLPLAQNLGQLCLRARPGTTGSPAPATDRG